MAKHTVVTMPGDGIGNQVLPEALRVLKAVGFDADYVHADIGWDCWCNEGNALPDRTIDLLTKHKLGLFGAITSKPNKAAQAELKPELQGKGRELAPVELELQHIVYATNFTAASLTVAPVAIALAEEFEAQLTLMHVIEDYENLANRPGPIEDGVTRLQALVPKDAALAYVPEIVMEFGSPSECILSTAAEREADLIVLGARPADRTTHLPWSTVHQVVAHATCPVLTVRG